VNQAANPKKRSLSGTTLTSHNSFAALDNEIIADIACDMGIDMPFSNFDLIDIMKGLEVARHSLKSINASKFNVSNVQKAQENDEIASELHLLEWIDDDSEAEQFTLVQSKKKKKRQSVHRLEKPIKREPLRRSKRIVPLVYRDKGGQENPVTSEGARTKKGVFP
jgi:hypothetical protein